MWGNGIKLCECMVICIGEGRITKTEAHAQMHVFNRWRVNEQLNNIS